MDDAYKENGWTISEVEQLTGLPRRDIQRCCYQGKGGVGILEPQNSTWGRRTYSVRDMAALFVVKLEKQEGLSLPEVAEKLQKQPAFNCETGSGMLAAHAARLAEQQEEIAGQLLAAQSLLISANDETSPDDKHAALGRLVEHEVDTQLAEAFRVPGRDAFGEMLPNVAPSAVRQPIRYLVRKVAAGAQRSSLANHDWFASCMEPLMELSAHAPEAPLAATAALARAIDNIHERYDVSHLAAKQALSWALDAPGMDVTLELWLGSSAHKLLMKTLR